MSSEVISFNDWQDALRCATAIKAPEGYITRTELYEKLYLVLDAGQNRIKIKKLVADGWLHEIKIGCRKYFKLVIPNAD